MESLKYCYYNIREIKLIIKIMIYLVFEEKKISKCVFFYFKECFFFLGEKCFFLK